MSKIKLDRTTNTLIINDSLYELIDDNGVQIAHTACHIDMTDVLIFKGLDASLTTLDQISHILRSFVIQYPKYEKSTKMLAGAFYELYKALLDENTIKEEAMLNKLQLTQQDIVDSETDYLLDMITGELCFIVEQNKEENKNGME